VAAAAPNEFAAADKARAEAQAFAGEVAAKVVPELSEKFVQPAPVVAKPLPMPKGGVPVKDGDLAAEPKPAAAPKEDEGETIIDADGQLIFDGSGKFGDAYQVVIFEDNVRLQNPQFLMNSDKLVAIFKEHEVLTPEPGGVIDALAEEPQEQGGSQLERAVASGREVTVTKTLENGEPQIAKARKATYFADREEVLLEIWPQVQRGKNLVIAKSKDTVIILKGEEMIVKGPFRTKIVGKGPVGAAGPPAGGEKVGSGQTVIDAEKGGVFNRASATNGEKEIFFEGEVAVADPDFDIFGDDLTAYMRENSKTGESEMHRAVVRGNKAEVQHHAKDGADRLGRAQRILYVAATSDVFLEDPAGVELNRGGEWIRRGTRVKMNETSKDFKVEGRSSIRFQPGVGPLPN
jgi:lipopolysaccharide export system protein LptA